jgi:hypothetical protein
LQFLTTAMTERENIMAAKRTQEETERLIAECNRVLAEPELCAELLEEAGVKWAAYPQLAERIREVIVASPTLRYQAASQELAWMVGFFLRREAERVVYKPTSDGFELSVWVRNYDWGSRWWPYSEMGKVIVTRHIRKARSA